MRKYRVVAEDLERVLQKMLAFSPQSSIPTSGIVGMLFSNNVLRIRVFNGVWVWAEIPLADSGETNDEDLFIAVRSNAIRIMLLKISQGEEYFSFLVDHDQIDIGGPKIGLMSSWTEVDLTPSIGNLSELSWNILPQEIGDICRVSLVDKEGSTSNLYITSAIILAISAKFSTSSYIKCNYPDISGIITIPYNAISPTVRGDEEILFALSGDLVVFSVNNMYVVTAQGHGYSELPWESFLLEDPVIVPPDAVSGQLLTELQIASLQSDFPIVYLWGDDDGLHYRSPGSESGSNSGTCWGRVKGLKFKGSVELLLRVISSSIPWKLGSYQQGTKAREIQALAIRVERATHIIMPIFFTEEEWERECNVD